LLFNRLIADPVLGIYFTGFLFRLFKLRLTSSVSIGISALSGGSLAKTCHLDTSLMTPLLILSFMVELTVSSAYQTMSFPTFDNTWLMKSGPERTSGCFFPKILCPSPKRYTYPLAAQNYHSLLPGGFSQRCLTL
jgi:hypothetical protein